jgi:hypothetical protein
MTDIEAAPIETVLPGRPLAGSWKLEWSPIVAGALVASAVSTVLVTFGTSVGLGISSASPTWRDASMALWLLSGIFLILLALVAFGCGGYLAGRTRSAEGAAATEETERRDGFHGIAAWALAVLIAALITAFLATAVSRPTAMTAPASTSEPSVLSYEIDHLLRAPRRLPTTEVAPTRAEAGRILLTSSSHSGVSSDDRAYLVQLVNVATGLTGPDAERRVDTSIANSRKAIANARAGTIILAFSAAASLLLGAVAAWAAAEAGGRHRDGMPLPNWMIHSSRFGRRRSTWERATPLP